MVGFISELKIIKVRETRESYALYLVSILYLVCLSPNQCVVIRRSSITKWLNRPIPSYDYIKEISLPFNRKKCFFLCLVVIQHKIWLFMNQAELLSIFRDQNSLTFAIYQLDNHVSIPVLCL